MSVTVHDMHPLTSRLAWETAHRRRNRLAVRFFLFSVAGIYGVMLLDAKVGLPIIFRLIVDGILLASIAYAGYLVKVTPESEISAAVRRIDSENAELENAFINACDFSSRLSQPISPTTAGLMRIEIARAEAAAAPLVKQFQDNCPLWQRPIIRKLLTILLMALLPIPICPRFFGFEVPRFLLSWEGTPPFTWTDFHISPSNPVVGRGGEVSFRATLGGKLPDRLDLVSQSGNGTPSRAPLMPEPDGTYRFTLKHLLADTSIQLQGETGRSCWVTIRVLHPVLQSGGRPSHQRSGKMLHQSLTISSHWAGKSKRHEQPNGRIKQSTGKSTANRSGKMIANVNHSSGNQDTGIGMKSNTNSSLPAPGSIQAERVTEPAGQAPTPIGAAPLGCPPEYRQLDAAYFKAVATGGRHSR